VLRFLVFLNGIAAVCLLFAYLSSYVDPQISPIFSFFGVLYPLFFIINVFFMLFWVFAKIKYVSISLIVLLIGFNKIGLYFSNNNDSEVSGKTITIASLNTQIGKKLFPKSEEARENLWKKFEDKLIDREIDVYCFQECNKPPRRLFDKFLADYNKYHPENSIAVTYTKHPIINQGHIKIGHIYNTCIWTDIQFPDQIVRVYNPHLSSNKISKKTSKLIGQPDLRDDKTWSDIKFIFNNYGATAKQRVKEVTIIKEHMAQSPYPIILAGDLNDTPLSYTYRLLTENLQDAFVCAGAGIGNTYAGSIPLLRIDYTLVDPKFNILNYEMVKEDFSDHYPIITTINLSE